MHTIQRLSLLTRDLRSNKDKLVDMFNSRIEKKNEQTNQSKISDSKKPGVKFNKSYSNDLSKSGLSNTLRGTREVLDNQNKSQIIKTKQTLRTNLKESTMSIEIPIKQIILEFTADHIRDNAGKYAAGTMLGLGAGLGYLAGDPEHSMTHTEIGGDNSNSSTGHQQSNIPHPDTRSDFQKDLGNASTTKTVDYHNDNKGLLGNLSNSVNHFTGNMKAENKFNDMTQAQEDYNNLKNSSGELLTSGQKLGLGAAGIGGLAMAAKLRRRR